MGRGHRRAPRGLLLAGEGSYASLNDKTVWIASAWGRFLDGDNVPGAATVRESLPAPDAYVQIIVSGARGCAARTAEGLSELPEERTILRTKEG